MSDTSISIVILSERSDAKAKDLYLPRLPHNPSQARFSLCRVVNSTVLGQPER